MPEPLHPEMQRWDIDMVVSKRVSWLIPASLIALAFIPVAAGTVRLLALGCGATVTPENARFFAAPLPVVLHIVSVTIYCILGAFQFAPSFRRKHARWHRLAGRALVPIGVIAAGSGLWMAMTYAIVPADTELLHDFRLLAGLGMAASLVVGFVAIRQRNVERHQAWMRRAYAIGQGAGTKALTQLPVILLFGPFTGLPLAFMMGGAWVLNLAVAEWLIRRRRSLMPPRLVPA